MQQYLDIHTNIKSTVMTVLSPLNTYPPPEFASAARQEMDE